MKQYKSSSDTRIRAINILLILILIIQVFPYVKDYVEGTPINGVSSYNKENDEECNNVLKALDKKTDKKLSEREKSLYKVCKSYKDIAKNKNDIAKITMACTLVANISEFHHDESDEIRSAFSSLVIGKSVCAGYARGVQLLLKSVGINSEIIHGCVKSETINHSWLIVYLDLDNDSVIEKYHCDPLWCDPDKEEEPLNFAYMLMSDEEALKTRTWEYEKYPICEFGVVYGDDVWIYSSAMKKLILYNN